MSAANDMTPEKLALFAFAILAIAFLYASVGHAGASGYVAVMGLFGLAPDFIKSMALILNILVSGVVFWYFWRAGHFSWRLYWPFAVLSTPFAFHGGYKSLPLAAFSILVGIILTLSAAIFLFRPHTDFVVRKVSRLVAIPVGAGIGLLAGLTGTGGGIFLSPLMLFMRWGKTKSVSAVSALFIFANSISGLFGILCSEKRFTSVLLNLEMAKTLLVAAVLGGACGSYFGSKHFKATTIKRLLAVVLLIAGIKLIFTN